MLQYESLYSQQDHETEEQSGPQNETLSQTNRIKCLILYHQKMSSSVRRVEFKAKAMGWEWSSEQSAHLALQEPQFRFDKLAAKKQTKTKSHTTKKAFTKKQSSKIYYAILSYLVSQMFPFNIPLIKVGIKYVGKKKERNQTIHLGGRGK